MNLIQLMTVALIASGLLLSQEAARPVAPLNESAKRTIQENAWKRTAIEKEIEEVREQYRKLFEEAVAERRRELVAIIKAQASEVPAGYRLDRNMNLQPRQASDSKYEPTPKVYIPSSPSKEPSK